MSISQIRPDKEAILKELKTYINNARISETEILDYIYDKKTNAELTVPATIFNSVISPLEAVVKYLKEAKGLRLTEIAKLTGRDQRAIGKTYRDAAKKQPEKSTQDTSKYNLPVNLLADKTLSVSEHIVKLFKDDYDLSYHELAVILSRDDRTVWTIYHRAQEKIMMLGTQATVKGAVDAVKDAVISEIKQRIKEYCISEPEVSAYLKTPSEKEQPQITVPVTIFNTTTSPLEAIVKYLKEVPAMKLVEIARLTGRDQRAIGVTYKNAAKKMPEQLKADNTKYSIPIEILQDKKLSIAEHIVKHIKETYNLNYHEIAILMKRDERTIWTLYNRAMKKDDGKSS